MDKFIYIYFEKGDICSNNVKDIHLLMIRMIQLIQLIQLIELIQLV